MKEILFCILAVLVPLNVQATMGTDPVNMAIAMVISSTYSSIVDSAEDFEEQKEDNGDAYISTQKEFAGQIESMKKAQTAAVTSTIKQHAISLMTHENGLEYLDMARSIYPCKEQVKTTALVAGNKEKEDVEDAILGAMQERNYNSTTMFEIGIEIDKFLKDTNVNEGLVLVPLESNSLSADQYSKATSLAAMLTNPSPDYNLVSDEHYLRGEGEKYQTFRKLKIAKVSLSQKVMAKYLANKAAIYPLSNWANEMASKAHFDVNRYLVDGKLSADAMLDIEVESRYASPFFVDELHDRSSTGVIRELVAMQAIVLEYQRRELEHQELMTALAAYKTSSEAQKLNKILGQRKTELIKQGN